MGPMTMQYILITSRGKIVPFITMAGAEAFQKAYGGTVMPIRENTPEVRSTIAKPTTVGV